MSVNFQHDIVLGIMEGPRNQNATSLRPMLHEVSLEEQGPSCHNEKKIRQFFLRYVCFSSENSNEKIFFLSNSGKKYLKSFCN